MFNKNKRLKFHYMSEFVGPSESAAPVSSGMQDSPEHNSKTKEKL